MITADRDGVGRYARELIPALSAAAPDDRFLVLRHPSNGEPLASGSGNVHEVFVEGVVGSLVDHFLSDDTRLRAVFDKEGWPDLYHGLFHMCARAFPASPGRPRPRLVLTLHDLIWLDYPFAHGPALPGIGTWLAARIGVIGSLRRADGVIAVSAATAAAAARWIPADKMRVVHHGVGAAFRPPFPPAPGWLGHWKHAGRPWIAAVSGAKRYKNLQLLIRAFAVARRRGVDAALILIGDCTPLANLARSLGIGDRVAFAGELGDEVLPAVVGGASLFVHPALVEGFGLPVVEAMALGTPTAVADVPALAEVAGDAALRFDPHDAEGLADIIERIVASPELRQEWSARAAARAACFTWERCARETLAVYRQVLGG